MLDRLILTHSQRERVRSYRGRGGTVADGPWKSNLSVVRVFSKGGAIRIRTPRQIASILTAKQTEDRAHGPENSET
jgi:hypothetical protein